MIGLWSFGMNVIKYQGNDRFFIALMEQDDNYFLFYAYTEPLQINREDEQFTCMWKNERQFINDIRIHIRIDLVPDDNNNYSLYHLIKLKHKESYDDIVHIMENIL